MKETWNKMSAEMMHVNVYTVLSPNGGATPSINMIEGACFRKGTITERKGANYKVNWPKDWIVTTDNGKDFRKGAKFVVWRSVGEYGVNMKFAKNKKELQQVIYDLLAENEVEFDRVIEDQNVYATT